MSNPSSRMINYEQCCKAQLLADAARRPDDKIEFIGKEEIEATKAEVGTPEMGWFQLAPAIEDELYYSQGDHAL